MKKLIALFLLFTMLAGISCGSESGQTDSTTASDTDTTVAVEKTRFDELGERNFEGKEFNIMASASMSVPSEENLGDVINDSLYDRDRKITELYNVDITYSEVAWQEFPDIVRQGVLAGDEVCNIILAPLGGSSSGISTLANENLLANLVDCEWLTLDAEYWSPLLYESCTLGGKLYFTAGDISPDIYRAPSCYYANKSLLTDYKIEFDEIYDAVEAGKWTLDYLNKIAGELDNDLNGDTTIDIENDFFGILNENNGLTASAFMVAAGVKLSTTNPDNTVSVDLNNEETINVIEKLESILSHVDYSGSNIHDAFKSDRAVFLMHYVASSFTRYRDMVSDFMILPLPKYDEAQSSYYSLVNANSSGFVGFPTNTDMDFSGFIAEALAYESRENVRPEVYDVSFKNKGARSERDADMLDLIFDTRYIDFNSYLEFGGSVQILSNSVFMGSDFASGYATVADMIKADTAKFADSWLGITE